MCILAHFYKYRFLELLFYSCQLIWQKLDRHQGLISLLGRGWNSKVTSHAVSPMALIHCAHGSASHCCLWSCCVGFCLPQNAVLGTVYLGATPIPEQRGGRKQQPGQQAHLELGCSRWAEVDPQLCFCFGANPVTQDSSVSALGVQVIVLQVALSISVLFSWKKQFCSSVILQQGM